MPAGVAARLSSSSGLAPGNRCAHAQVVAHPACMLPRGMTHAVSPCMATARHV